MSYVYAVRLEPEDGVVLVSCRDLPEVQTAGATVAEALEQAADAVETAVSYRAEREEDVPVGSPPEEGEHVVFLTPGLEAKLQVYAAWRRSGLTKAEIARRLKAGENEVRRILNPRHATKIDRLDAVARVLGKRLTVGISDAA